MKNLNLICEAKLLLEKSEGDRENQTGKIEARVTTWGPREGADGRKFFYKPEGFAEWAQEFTGAGRPLPMFVNHVSDSIPVGEWTGFEFDEEGMTATGRLYTNTTQGSDLYKIMQESPEMFGGVSVGAYADEACWVREDGSVYPAGDNDYWEDGFFQVTKGGLREVSVVIHPNNPSAEVMKLEFFRQDGSADLKVLESALRDAGLSKSEAVAAASVFKRVIELREVTKESVESAPSLGDPEAEATKEELLKALEARELVRQLEQRLKG